MVLGGALWTAGPLQAVGVGAELGERWSREGAVQPASGAPARQHGAGAW